MKIPHFFFLFLLINFSVYGQYTYDKSKISNKVLKIVKKIEKVNVVMDEGNGVGRKSGQYENFEELIKIASPKELAVLTSYPNGVVRCYAFIGLTSDEKLKETVDIFKIVKDHIQDNEFVESQSGCIISSESVVDFFVRTVEQKDYKLNFYAYELNSQQQKEIDSLLIAGKNDSYARQKAIQSLEINAQNYPLLRKLVIEQKNDTALPKLAEYKKEEDLQLILGFHKIKTEIDEDERLYATYLAVQQFPHPVFFSLLKQEQNKTFNKEGYSNEWRELYKAVVQYKNQGALELLQLPFIKVYSDIRKYHLRFVYEAIVNNPNPLYDELLWKFWEEENINTLDSFNHLLGLDPKRVYKNIRKEFGITSEIKNPNLDRKNFSEIDNRQELMLNLLIVNEKEIALEVIKNKIKQANVHDFPLYTKYVLKFKNRIFVEPLLERLRVEKNANVYLEAVKTLFGYNDDAINAEIVKTLAVNKSLTENWGGTELKRMLLEKKLIKE